MRRSTRRRLLVAACAAACVHAARAQTPVTYVGPNGGAWSNPAHWSTGVVPINSGSETFAVTIPNGFGVLYNVGAPAAIDSLAIQGNSNLTYSAAGADLTIGGALSGSVALGAGSLNALSTQSNAADNLRLAVSAGGAASVAASGYSSMGLDGVTLFSANAPTASILFPNLSSLTFGSPFGNRTQTISAIGGGSIAFPALQSLSVSPGQDDGLTFRSAGGGGINLPQLATINAVGNGSGRVSFEVDSGALTLPALANIDGGGNLILGAAVTATLPALSTHLGQAYAPERSLYSLNAGATLNANALVSMQYVTLSQQGGSTFNAPSLVDITGSVLNLSPAFAFNTATLGQIDHARIAVTGGLVWGGVIDGDYDSRRVDGGTLFSATGAGSRLNLPTLASIRFAYDFGNRTQTILASGGGVVDLSGLQSIRAVDGQDDGLTFRYDSGTINLSQLASIDSLGNGFARVTFDVASGSLNLPALSSAVGGLNLTLAPSVVAHVPALVTVGGINAAPERSNFSLGAGAVVNAPMLQTLNYATLNPGQNAALIAPMLRDVTGAVLNLRPDVVFTTAPLAEIDQARILVSNGLQYANVTDVNYDSRRVDGLTIFSATGAGSRLDLPSLETLTFGFEFGNRTQTILASAGGVVDLSGLHSAQVLPGQDDGLQVTAQSGGSVRMDRLANLAALGNGFGRLRFNAESGGSITLGGGTFPTNVHLGAADPGSLIDVQGGVHLLSGSTVAFGGGTILRVGGDLSHVYANEAHFAASSAIVEMAGDAQQSLEVAGFDTGPVDPGNAGNFGLGQLVVGRETQANILQLVDVFDNGNRGALGDPEALYLFGLGGPDGLRLLNGSVLIVDNLNVYTRENGLWVSLQTLFAGGATLVPYSDGFIARDVQRFQLFWDNPGSGAWDIAVNWTGDEDPNPVHEVFITPAATLTVSGPTADVRVRSLTVDNDADGAVSTLRLDGAASLAISNGLAVGPRGRVELAAGQLAAGAVLSDGAIEQGADTLLDATLLVNNGVLASSGTLSVSGEMQNRGAYSQLGGAALLGSITGDGATAVAAGASLLAGRIEQDSLSVAGAASLIAGRTETSRLRVLDVSGAGRFDIADRRVILDGMTEPAVFALIASAHAGGAWTGPGLTTSAASGATAIGYARAGDIGVSSFGGLPVAPDSILVGLTLVGDTNLDQRVDVTDLGRLASNWQGSAGWSGGDFTYDGLVDVSDLGALATNWQVGVTGPAGPDSSLHAALLGAGLGAVIPEPAGLSLLAVSGLALRRRR